jgi:periplasmic divalent cation tolerance protein
MTEHIRIFVTCRSAEECAKIARHLVQARLIACGNIIPGIRSIYMWKGNIEDDGEALLIMKTRSSHFDHIVKEIKALHSYEVPEIIASPITQGHDAYLNWIDDVTRPESD